MKLPRKCPSCGSELCVRSLSCNNCDTKIDGNYTLPMLLMLEDKSQEFILEFVKSSGSLKKMSKSMNLSYPTIRNLLDEIIESITNLEDQDTQSE